jgi:CARDB
LDFLDEDPVPPTATESVPPPSPGRSRRGRKPPRPERQQILIRRAIAAGGGLLLLILIVLGVKGCLSARAHQALEDYTRNVATIVDSSNQTSSALFKRLEDPGSLSTTEYEAEIASYRGAMDSLYSRVQGLSTPDEMSQAQKDLENTFRLRRDALTQFSDNLPTALGKEGSDKAVSEMTKAMQTLYGGDVIYTRYASPEIKAVEAQKDITQPIPRGTFLPDFPGTHWLDPNTVQESVGLAGGGTSAAATPGVHGLGLISTSANGTSLTEGTPATVSAGGKPELSVQVQNQGDQTESGVTVSVTVNGGSPTEQQISTIAPGATESVTIPLTPAPKGSTDVAVEVRPVPGEQVTTNNKATYTVNFQ